MELEWDGDKAASNLKNHGVDFADAATVLLDDMAITIRDDSIHEEERFVTLGSMDTIGRVLVVVYAMAQGYSEAHFCAASHGGRTTTLRK